ncbi:5'-deoxynucleotidase HDDC2-like isoform X1 [Clavelina lepadiformis]|uniref:5'-deoxynucleotidase HDDC2-like isoform X1 n=2 Tax=Clavelina lepadiformis TaxID=159417 RepID=UPI004041EE92
MEMLKFLTLVGKLKRTKRSGWVANGIKDPESVSDHMYRMSIMALVLNDSSGKLNRDHCIKLSLVHDLAECIVGDITPHDNVPQEEKHRREVGAMQHLGTLVDRDVAKELHDLFMEYENQDTPESRFVKDLDRFDMVLQAHHYEEEVNDHKKLEEFFQSVKGKFTTDVVKDLFEKLSENRNLKQCPRENSL